MEKKKITGSFIAKAAAFFLLAVSAFCAAGSGLLVVYLADADYYTEDFSGLFLNESRGILMDAVYEVRECLTLGEVEGAKAVCEGKNFDITLFEGLPDRVRGNEKEAIWTSSEDIYEGGLTSDFTLPFSLDESGYFFSVGKHIIYSGDNYVFRVSIDTNFPEPDALRNLYNKCSFIYGMKYRLFWVLGIGIFIMLNTFLFLMCSAGHRNDSEGIQPGVFASIPLDLYTAGYGTVAVFLLLLLPNSVNVGSDALFGVLFFSVLAAALVIWCTFYFRELAVRLKLGRWWRNTVIFYVIRLTGRTLRFFWKMACAAFRGIPIILNTLICFFGICILEFIVLIICRSRSDLALLWMLEKVALLPAIFYLALMCKRLLGGSQALAEGRQDEIVDTTRMFGDFKQCGENLNSIGQGIAKAVEERMKSEHLKTELISNVSHDLKTPLTSIINYANLIAAEPSENAKITEYSEVLVRQSGRLKKLLEDLLEASKATTGNLEVNLQPCEVSVILSQALGEYQQRMEEKQLELIVTQPKEQVGIMADGRHLWRIFDNLLNNICKYAREDSRVYLSVEQKDNMVVIIFRNMSKYVLNVSPEELQERFVRGDKSRHMEGNGLGLSIAGSLTELQNGRMEIVTDGDLFKVSLWFTKL